MKILGWTSQLVVINSSEHWWGHHSTYFKYVNYLSSLTMFVNELEQLTMQLTKKCPKYTYRKDGVYYF